MKMEHRLTNAVVDVEKFSKLGTEDLQNNQPQRALESFKYAYKRSRELDDGYTERACAFNLGAVYIAIGEFRKGVDTLEKSVPPDNKREGRSNGDLYFNFGIGFEGLGNNEEAVRNYNKALEEYKVERDNVKMEAECLEKLVQIYVKTQNQFAAETFNQLAAVYSILDNPVKQMWALSERAYQLHIQGQLEEAESIAEECLKLSSKCGSDAPIGNIYNDLGLIFTQIMKYDRALFCFEQSLPLVQANTGDRKQEAVVLQNLGATYNLMEDYQKAVSFDERAADLFAKLRNRNSQGQCFANLASAHSQLGNLDDAAEAFLHAFQAAKDTGDKRTQWQVCEGLGAVAFRHHDFSKAINYFKKALGFSAATEMNNADQDRIVSKLTKALECQAIMVQNRDIEQGFPVLRGSRREPLYREAAEEVREETVVKQSTPAKSAAQNKHRQNIKFVPVARHGSMRRFQKVALGLGSATSSSLGHYDTMAPISSRSTSSASSSAEDDEKDNASTAKQIGTKTSKSSSDITRRTSSGLGMQAEEAESETDSSSSSEEESEEKEENSDDDEKKAVKEAMKKIDDQSSGESSSEEEENHVEARVNVKAQSGTESDSDTAPPVPTQSPPMTTKSMDHTYETPARAKKKLHYGEIDFVPRSPQKKGEMQTNPNFLSDEDEVSLPSSQDTSLDEAVEALKGRGSSVRRAPKGSDILEASGTYHNDEIEDRLKKVATIEEEEDPVYQSIRSKADTLRNEDNEVDTPSFEKTPEFKTFSSLPRGIQSATNDEESARFEEHRRLVQERENRPPVPERNKESKTCVVM